MRDLCINAKGDGSRPVMPYLIGMNINVPAIWGFTGGNTVLNPY